MRSGDREAPVPARWRAGDRFASVALRRSLAASPFAGLVVVGIGLVTSWLVVYLMGGAGNLVPHLFYVPILFAAVRFGPVAALSTALLAGVLAGPLTYLDVATGTPQELDRWVSRTVFFATIGVGMAALVRPSLPSVGDDLRRRRTAGHLRQALDAGELFVRYQPVLSMRTGAVYGVEALVRWDHPEFGELEPGAFVPDAEASRMIQEVDAFVLEDACRRAVHWQSLAAEHGRPAPRITVNLSRANLEGSDVISSVRDILRRTGVDPGQICLEVTESMLVEDVDVSAARLAGLKTLGVVLAVDDFGTGYSSLSAIHRFPVDVLKVDRAFLAALNRDPHADTLVGALVLLSRSLGVTLIAEGVEDRAQRDTLVEFGYDLVQGFYYAYPLMPAEIDPLVTAAAPFEAVAVSGGDVGGEPTSERLHRGGDHTRGRDDRR